MKEITIIFYAVDEWNRPVFKEVIKKENGEIAGCPCYFGDVNKLFDYGAEKEVIDYYSDLNVNDYLLYFGSHFNCEPLGYKPDELKEPVKLVFDVELSKKLHEIV